MLLSSYLKQLKCIENEELSSMEHFEPFLFKCDINSEKPKFYNMNKKVKDQVYSILELDKRMSDKLYAFDPELWKKLIERVYSNKGQEVFAKNYVMFGSTGFLVDTVEDVNEFYSCINNLCDQLDKYESETICNSSGTLVTKVYDLSCSTAILVISMNFDKNTYAVHQGRISPNGQIYLFSNPSVLSYDLYEFISSMTSMGIEDQLEVTSQIVNNSVEDEKSLSVNLSVREMIDFIGRAKLQLSEDEMGIINDIESVNDSEVKSKLLSELSIMPFKSLKKMNYLRKSIKWTRVSINEMLQLLSDNINESNAIDGFILADLKNLCMNTNSDKMVVESERLGD